LGASSIYTVQTVIIHKALHFTWKRGDISALLHCHFSFPPLQTDSFVCGANQE